MGGSLNICALLVGLAAFARWTIPFSNVTRRMGLVNWLGGVGILALLFSIVSPDDDAFQQELIRPTPFRNCVFAHEGCSAGIVCKFVDQRLCSRRRPHHGSTNLWLFCRG